MRIVAVARAMQLAPIVLLVVLPGVGFGRRGVAIVTALWLRASSCAPRRGKRFRLFGHAEQFLPGAIPQ
jgi:hypothetical protein